MNDSSRFIEEFRQEAEELLTGIEDTVLDIEDDPEDKEAINKLFRAMHTIKGSGAMFGFDAISDFTHHVETVLDKVRGGTIPVSKTLIDLILVSRDRITALLEEAGGGPAVDPQEGEDIIASLEALLSGDEPPAKAPAKGVKEPEPAAAPESKKKEDGDEKGDEVQTLYRIRMTPSPNIFATGMDPVLLIEDLKDLGEGSVVAQTDKVPELEELDPETCYIYWDVTLSTSRDRNSIRDVFIFVENDCEINIEVIEDQLGAGADDEIQRLGDILIERGDITREDVEKSYTQRKHLGELLVESGAVSKEKLKSALNEQKLASNIRKTAEASSVRVPSERLDKLINLVGELVITQARLTQVASEREDMELAEPVEEIERLTGELRDSVLNIRMMPIGTTFNKFRRLVRDLSSQLKKKIELVTEGAETEMDKTVLEKLGDPLVHLIRNSIDHGVESPEARKNTGKRETGTILLSAAHKGTSVMITIKDDGAGLNAERIKQKALEKGLISESDDLSEKQIYAQIFAPGFSTSQEVTSVSGRGVGMDVVKRTIENLRGVIDIDSNLGEGTVVTLKLPLTLAIINGLLVQIGQDFFVLPLMAVDECVEINSRESEKINGRNILNVRGEMVPYVRLRDYFRINGTRPKSEHVVITEVNDNRIGFVVDHVIGGHQTVIKPLGPAFKNVRDISGATILGDGTVALIIDTNVLLEKA